MKMYLPFGDWSDDGHGRYETVLIEAPSMEHLLNAQIKIKEKYGEHFFSSFANDYEEPYIGEKVWQALIDTNYPIERFRETQDDIMWDKCNSITEVIAFAESEEYDDIYVTLDTVKDAFIWLLNAFGAEIKVCEEYEKIPMICNWTCNGFEDVGYGCFYS